MRQVLTQNGGQSSPTRWSAEPALQSRDVSMQWRHIVWCRCRPIPKYHPVLSAAPVKDCSTWFYNICCSISNQFLISFFLDTGAYFCCCIWNWNVFPMEVRNVEHPSKTIWVKWCIIETQKYDIKWYLKLKLLSSLHCLEGPKVWHECEEENSTKGYVRGTASTSLWLTNNKTTNQV